MDVVGGFINYQDQERLLFLVMDNDATSSSASGLKSRAKNRAEMRTILCSSLGLSDDEAEQFYQDKIDERERE